MQHVLRSVLNIYDMTQRALLYATHFSHMLMQKNLLCTTFFLLHIIEIVRNMEVNQINLFGGPLLSQDAI